MEPRLAGQDHSGPLQGCMDRLDMAPSRIGLWSALRQRALPAWCTIAAIVVFAAPSRAIHWSSAHREGGMNRSSIVQKPQPPDAAELPAPQGKMRTWIEGFAAPGGLRPMMQVLGQASGFGPEGDWYATEIFPVLMGVCGDAFRFTWYRRDGGSMQQSDRFAVATPAAQYLPALEAAGFGARIVFSPRLTGGRGSAGWDEAALRRGIVASIAERGWPALLLDVPEPGWTAVVTGYRNNGETLVGWCEPGWESFGFGFEAAKKREFGNWFAGAGSVVLLTGRRTRPAESEVLRSALERAAAQLRRRAAGRVMAGPATYEELARRLDDASLTSTDDATARRRDALLFPMIWDLATQRHYAGEFVRHAAEVFTGASQPLTAAANLFTGIHDAVWELNRLGGGADPGSSLPKLADPVLRRRAAQIILRCRDRDLEAAAKIEEALAAIGAQKPASRAWPRAFSLPAPDPARFQGPRFPENMPQAGVLGAAMDLLGDDLALRWDEPDRFGLRVDRPHAFFMGLTGEAFTFFWFPRKGPRPGLDPTLYWPDPGTPYRRALAAAGYACEVVARPGLTQKQPGRPDGAALKARIVECLVDRRLPVIAAGVPGPGEFLLVTGYEEGGDALTGWVSRGGAADVRFERDKRVQARDWVAAADLVVLLSGRRPKPTEKASIRGAVASAERVMRPPVFGPFHAGPASFDAWAEAILADRPPAATDVNQVPGSVAARRRWLIVPTAWDLMERMAYAGFFIDRAIALYPDARKELTAANDALGAVGVATVQACSLTGGDPGGQLSDAEQDAKLADPAVRRELADLFLGCKARWIEAADHLAKALPLMR